MFTLKLVFYTIVVLAILSSAVSAQAKERQAWILIDTKSSTLIVISADNHEILRFHNIAIGSGGVAEQHLRGDETTPLGIFHVAWINSHSRFETFFGLDYPTPSLAVHAYITGAITSAEFDAIIDAAHRHNIPPQNTPLGGQLGIHGLGSGNLLVAQSVDWTDGCVAVTNREIRLLAHWVHIGTKIIIR